MSIENQLADLTAAVRELTAALKAQATPVEKSEPPQETEAGNEARRPRGRPAKTPTAEETQSAAPDTPDADAKPAAESPSDDGLLDYDTDVKPLFLKLIAKKGRDEGVAFIKSFKEDAAKLNEALTPEQYPEAVAKLKELLG